MDGGVKKDRGRGGRQPRVLPGRPGVARTCKDIASTLELFSWLFRRAVAPPAATSGFGVRGWRRARQGVRRCNRKTLQEIEEFREGRSPFSGGYSIDLAPVAPRAGRASFDGSQS